MQTLQKLRNLNEMSKGTLMEYLHIEFTESGEGYLCARMPVDLKVHQPFGLLHGGATAALAESTGSAASFLLLEGTNQIPLAIEINASHLRSVRSGYVHAKASILKRSKTHHTWKIEVTDDNDELICTSRLVVAIVEQKHSKH